MEPLLFIAVLIAAGLATVLALQSRKSIDDDVGTESGICEVAQTRSSAKTERKQQILAMLEEQTELSSADVAGKLDISQRTARRDLSELVEAGEVTQHGEVGRFVTYTRS